MIGEISPGLILVLGALPLFALRGPVRAVWTIALPLLALAQLWTLPAGELGQFEFLGLSLTTLRVDELSLLFASAFLVALLVGMIYALHVTDTAQHVAAMIYGGSAVGAVLAGDLVTLFVFWEGTAIASVFLIWASRDEGAVKAGMRYLIIQVTSGLLLLEGVLVTYHETHSVAFESIGFDNSAGWMILAAVGIKAAFPILHAWLPDAYPRSTPTGTVFLAAFSTKLAIYALLRGFVGAEILVPIGVVMVIFPLIYAALENDLRRTLCYVLISQLGFMVVGVGIGTELSVAGAAAHAVSNLAYSTLLFMVVGAVLHRGGTALASDIGGGLYRTMPMTAAFSAAGAAAIGLPLFCGYVSQAMIVAAAMEAEMFWVWIVLAMGGVGAFVLGGLRVTWSAFLKRGAEQRAGEEAPSNMLAAMGITAAITLLLGIVPGLLVGALPYDLDFQAYTVPNVLTQLQLLAFALLAFLLMMRAGICAQQLRGTSLDADWLYRRGGRALVDWTYANVTKLRRHVVGLAGERFISFFDRLYRHYGPQGALARTWPTGAMAFWSTVLLAIWLFASYV